VGWKQYFVYMMTNRWKNVLYTGMTNSLEKRVWQHKNHAVPGFTKRYNCDRLVYFETYTEVDQAIARETQIKGWSRPKKNALVASLNPDWNDLAADWYNDRVIPSRADGEESPASHEEGDPSLRSG
jgi:putative endonuclease